jgi:hypothetical protein
MGKPYRMAIKYTYIFHSKALKNIDAEQQEPRRL